MFMYGMIQYQWLWVIWNGDRDIVFSGKDILMLRLLGYALFCGFDLRSDKIIGYT